MTLTLKCTTCNGTVQYDVTNDVHLVNAAARAASQHEHETDFTHTAKLVIANVTVTDSECNCGYCQEYRLAQSVVAKSRDFTTEPGS